MFFARVRWIKVDTQVVVCGSTRNACASADVHASTARVHACVHACLWVLRDSLDGRTLPAL